MKEHAVAKENPSRHGRSNYPTISWTIGDTDDTRDEEKIAEGKEEWLGRSN